MALSTVCQSDAALAQTHEADLRVIEERHAKLAAELGIEMGADVERHLAELRHIAAGVALIGEVSDRTRARVMSTGELMATELGARYLQAQGLDRPIGTTTAGAASAARRMPATFWP